ncbi:NAD-dependent epimerase/dehydratase family protein, partial [Candidatus Nomurabacteria bacterium]|nr:NAD-dependent epimerase/dehydratase family protein [Candidatus Nomurabacteria bacterium]
PIETHEINVNGLLNVLEACRVNKVKRLVFAASSASYGNQETLPLTESMNAMPLSPYGTHKYIGEVYCALYSRVYNLETVSLRYFNVYGPRQLSTGAYASVIAKFLDLKKSNMPMTITGDGEQTRSFVHVHDVVTANILAMKSENVGKGEVINIGTNEMYSVNQIAKLLGGEFVYIDPRIEPRATSADIAKAKELLNWQPSIKFEDALIELKKYHNIS